MYQIRPRVSLAASDDQNWDPDVIPDVPSRTVHCDAVAPAGREGESARELGQGASPGGLPGNTAAPLQRRSKATKYY
ncbi:jg17491 [Pararge aegeria aegeria]|uniref:Jg17491 protein n=1 Tax=Pararge aegeria aegeria TaxID=348720 RepID=A0A8S4RN70_9NEOP|nr:jg17491 [Pararge aegeria aegeria]